MGSMSESDFSRLMNRWLKTFDLIAEPFELYEADREHDLLPQIFVDRPYLHAVLGNPSAPQPAFLLAKRGEGKSATREMLIYQYKIQPLRGEALPVKYTDFAPLIEQAGGDPQNIQARHHVYQIVRQIAQALVNDVPLTYFEQLDEFEKGLLAGYIKHFGSPVIRASLGKKLNCPPEELDWDELTPLETLQTLAELVTKLGPNREKRYRSIYVLIDRVDETHLGLKGAAAMLAPFVREVTLLEAPKYAFKFFLPVEVGQELRRAALQREERAVIEEIDWNRAELERMLDQRVRHFSDGKLSKFLDLFAYSIRNRVLDDLIEVVGLSPRGLLRICHNLVRYHVEHGREPYIDSRSRSAVLDDYLRAQDSVELQSQLNEQVKSSAEEIQVPETGLFLHQGHLWLDGSQLDPPLSGHEFSLLQELYLQSPKVIENNRLIRVVWGDNASGEDDQNLRKLITRLRARLEPGKSGDSQFIKNARGRGYWLVKSAASDSEEAIS
jgi:DNA-binding winged helix-turn-helix (wHTH) protein